MPVLAIGSVLSILPVGAVLPISAILAMIDGDGIPHGKGNGVAHGLAALGDGRHRSDDVTRLLGRDDGLQRGNVLVHLLAQLFQPRDAALEVVQPVGDIRQILTAGNGQKGCKNGED